MDRSYRERYVLTGIWYGLNETRKKAPHQRGETVRTKLNKRIKRTDAETHTEPRRAGNRGEWIRREGSRKRPGSREGHALLGMRGAREGETRLYGVKKLYIPVLAECERKTAICESVSIQRRKETVGDQRAGKRKK